MKFLFSYKFLLLYIFLVGFFLRFFQLGSNPPALTWDEVAWGYNAYSLGIDGRDEFGQFFPYDYLESFGDFKPPLYAYLDVLPIKVFGLTEFAVRFPSALFGVLTVLLTYFLVKEIFNSSNRKEYYALFATFLLAVSPWHINLSRAAFEANVAQFFIVTGVYLFLLALRKNMWLLSFSAISFALSFYTFNTSRVFVPILVIVLTSICFKKLWRSKKQTIVAGLVGFAILLPIIGFLFSPQASLRFKEVNIFTNPEIVERANQEIENDDNSLLSKALHNRRLKYSVSFLSHYFDHFSPSFLFIKGDGNPKFSTQDVGQLYLWSMPFLIIGGLLLFRKREGRWWIVPVWLLLGIIPAATARETPHALRIETVLPTFQILIAYGAVSAVYFLREKIKKPLYFRTILVFVFLLLISNIGYYLYGYYAHYSREYSGEWQYGYKQALSYVVENENDYDQIYMTDKLGRPYIYYLFFSKTHPNKFRKDSDIKRDTFGFVNVSRVGKYNFTDNLDVETEGSKTLYINDPLNVPKDARVLKQVNNLNGEPALFIYTR